MRANKQSRVAQTRNHTSETVGALSPAAEAPTEINDQASLDELADSRFFEPESEPRTGGPIATHVEFPEYE